jgi:tetratricopeptide (TPR) repeat protein
MNQEIEILEQTLSLARKNGDRQGEARTMCSLGTHYLALGKTLQAMELLDQSVELATEIGDSSTVGQGLWSMCLTWFSTGSDPQIALDLGRVALGILEKLGDPTAELAREILAAQQDTVMNPDQIKDTIESYHQELDRTHKQKDLLGEFNTLGKLGHAYRKSSEPEFVPARCFQLQLKIARKLRDVRYEAIAQSNLSAVRRDFVRKTGMRQTLESKRKWWQFWS